MVEEHALWCRDPDGRLLMCREDGKRREGLWRLPTRRAEEVSGLPVKISHRYTITRYRVMLSVHAVEVESVVLENGESWVDEADLSGLAMASPFRRVLEKLIGENPV